MKIPKGLSADTSHLECQEPAVSLAIDCWPHSIPIHTVPVVTWQREQPLPQPALYWNGSWKEQLHTEKRGEAGGAHWS